MKEVIKSKALKKMLILTILVAGLVFVTNSNGRRVNAAIRDCPDNPSIMQDCYDEGRYVSPFNDCECGSCIAVGGDCPGDSYLNYSTCRCEGGTLSPGGECDPPRYGTTCTTNGGYWDGCQCHYY